MDGVAISGVDSRRQACSRLSEICSLCVVALGSTGAIGWLASVDHLKRLLPNSSPMVFNTSILLVLLGLALFFVQDGRKVSWRLTLVRSIAALAFTVGTLTTAQYLFGLDLGIDQALLRGYVNDSIYPPGRMSPISAAAFATAGAALFLLSVATRRAIGVMHVVATFGIVLSLFSLVGYLYSVAALTQLPGTKPIALPSAVAFTAAFLGIHLAKPSSGHLDTVLNDEAGASILRRFVGIVIAIPLALGGLVSLGLQADLVGPLDGIVLLVVLMMLALLALLVLNAVTLLKLKGLHQRSERRYRLLFDNLADCVFIHDLSGTVTEVNEIACRRLGYDRERLIGMPFHSIHSFPQGSERSSFYSELAAKGVALSEATQRTSAGMALSVEVNSRAMPGADVGTVLSVVRDISDRKKAERALLETRERLMHSQKMEAVGRLAGGIAHDFNNLVAVINLACGALVGSADLPVPLADCVREIQSAAQRAAILTHQLLLFSRKRQPEKCVVGVSDIVSGMAGLMRRIVGEDITLRTELAADVPAILGDTGQLEQVLMNLIVNSRDAMPTGGEIIISTGVVELAPTTHEVCGERMGGTYAVIRVQDNGSGMDEETRKHVFEPFFSTKGPGKGSGLGLSTVYGIIRQHDGHIDVLTELGRGTTFALYLPRTDVAAPTQAPFRATPAARVAFARTVLLVEDEGMLRRMLAKILRGQGYSVMEADSASNALASLRTTSPGAVDVVLTDVIMPAMSGIELATAALEEFPGVRVLLMSGHAPEELAQRFECILRDPRVSFVPKPFTSEQISVKIRELVFPSDTVYVDRACSVERP